jgi:hypothetical protein
MGCCEIKSIQSDLILYPDRLEVKPIEHSFDDISIYTQGEEAKKYISTSPQPQLSFASTFNSIELAFLMGTSFIKSKTQSVLASIE